MGLKLFVTARDIPQVETGTSDDTLARAVAMRTDFQGRPGGPARLSEEGPTWGGIRVVPVEGNLAAWELKNPLPLASPEISFGLIVVGESEPRDGQSFLLTGGLAPFYGGSYSPSPRQASTLPVPRFVPRNESVNVLL